MNNVNRFQKQMIEGSLRVEQTPSVCFNFEQSNLKSDRNRDLTLKHNSAQFDADSIPFEYSDTNYKNINALNDIVNDSLKTPPHSYLVHNQQIFLPFDDSSNHSPSFKRNSIKRTLNFHQLSGKVDTEEFFDDFQNHFVVKFGDSPIKFQENVDFKKKQSQSNDSSDQKNAGSKIRSHISEPLAKDLHRGSDEVENQEISQIEIDIQERDCQKIKLKTDNITRKCLEENKQNLEGQKSKIPFQIRKRTLFKNQEVLANKTSKNRSRPGKRLINTDNLMIVTSSGWGGWTGIPQTKKWKQEIRSHHIKCNDKTLKKENSNIFSSHQMFKQTLRSTTLDNWRKKFTVQKTSLGKKTKVSHNIFQRPFGIR